MQTMPKGRPAPGADIVRDGPVVTLAMHRPESLNAIDDEVLSAVHRLVDQVEEDPDVRVCIVAATGPNFSVGADLKAFGDDVDPDAVVAFTRRAAAAFSRLAEVPVLTIAALRGLVLGGGLELAIACDLLVASDTTRVGDAHANVGLVPGGGASARLPRLVGLGLARRLMLTGDFLPVQELRGTGLFHEIVADADLEERVRQLAGRLSGRSAHGLATMKRLVNSSLERSLEDAIEQELVGFAAHAATPDFREGLTAFREGRTPVFPTRTLPSEAPQ